MCTTYQLKSPLEISTIIEVSDPVYTFCEVMDHIDLRKYLITEENKAPSFMTIDNFMNNCLLDNIFAKKRGCGYFLGPMTLYLAPVCIVAGLTHLKIL